VCVCLWPAEDASPTSKPLHHSKPIEQSRESPVAATHGNRKRQAPVLSSRGKTKARKNNSAINLPRYKHVSSSAASAANANIGRQSKVRSRANMPSKPAGSNKVTPGRQEDSIKFLSAERKRLEKENKEKKRQLEELRKQEMLIETAAKKGGG